MRLSGPMLVFFVVLAAASPALAQSAVDEGLAAYDRGDYPTAASKFQQACNAGIMRGCTGLGILYENGEGVTQDKARAAALYKQACDGGSASGCTGLGSLYEYGEGVTQDKTRAATLYEQGCKGGDAVGCSFLGLLN